MDQLGLAVWPTREMLRLSQEDWAEGKVQLEVGMGGTLARIISDRSFRER